MQTLYTSLLTIEELSAAGARLLPIITPLIAGNPLLIAIATAAQDHHSAIVLASSRQASSNYTGPLKEADATRDAAFSSLRDYCATGMKDPIATPERRAAAARLVQIIALHGNTLHHLGYNRQSGKMTALIADLGKASATADLTALNLLPLFNQLSAAQSAFEEIVAEKTAVEGGETLPTFAEHRPELERQLNLLLAAIEEWHDLAPSPASTAAVGQMDEIIVQIATPALTRRTKSEPTPTLPPAP
jgi:hypothetical protein